MERPIGQLVTDLANAAPDRPAVTCGNTTMSRRTFDAAANRLARAYERLGVREGSFVTIALPNGVEFYVVAFALWKLGAVPQPVSYRLPQRERDAIVELADPALVVGVPEGAHGSRPTVPPGYEADPTLSNAPIDPPRVSPAWKAPTSGGSTGRPKLIVSGQRGVFDPASILVFGMTEDGVQLVPGPLYHNAPFALSVSGLLLGNHLVVLERFDAAAALEAIQRHRVDWVNLVPTMMLRMLRVLEASSERHDLGSLKRVWHMAAPCPAWLKEAWIELVGPETLMELYGGTEGQAACVVSGSEWLSHRGTVGRPAFGEMVVLDEEGKELPHGEVGEIFMRPPTELGPTYRYVGAKARTRDGWESLGDLGWMDDEGYVYLSDRRVDLILSGGANIYPAEVEAALMEHPAVDTVVVVGLPDEDLGQRVHAVVQASDRSITDEHLRAFLADRLAPYKVPRSFRFVTEQLRDDAGKTRRAAIRDQEVALLVAGAPGVDGSA